MCAHRVIVDNRSVCVYIYIYIYIYMYILKVLSIFARAEGKRLRDLPETYVQWLTTQVSDRPHLSNAIKKFRSTFGTNNIHVQHTQAQAAAMRVPDSSNTHALSKMSSTSSSAIARDGLNVSHASPCHEPGVCNPTCAEGSRATALDPASHVKNGGDLKPGENLGTNHVHVHAVHDSRRGHMHVHAVHDSRRGEDEHSVAIEGILDSSDEADLKHPSSSSMLSGTAAHQNRSHAPPAAEAQAHDAEAEAEEKENDQVDGRSDMLASNTTATGEVRQGIYRVFRASNVVKKPPSDLNGEETAAVPC